MTDFATPKYQATNRSEKRKMGKEYQKIFDKLYPVEDRFCEQLFLSEYDYHTLYSFYLEQFKYSCKWVSSVVKPRYWTLNGNYFFDTYGMIEKEDEFMFNNMLRNFAGLK